MARPLKADYSVIYLHVLKLVKSGITIQNACIVVNTTSKTFYRNITKAQRQELKFYKIIMKQHPNYGRAFMSPLTDEDE